MRIRDIQVGQTIQLASHCFADPPEELWGSFQGVVLSFKDTPSGRMFTLRLVVSGCEVDTQAFPFEEMLGEKQRVLLVEDAPMQENHPRTIRDLWEQEFQQELQHTVKDDPDLLQFLRSAYKDDHTTIERQVIHLQDSYKTVHLALRRLSSLSGIPIPLLFHSLRHVQFSMRLTLPQVVSQMLLFYGTRQRLEQEQQGKGKS